MIARRNLLIVPAAAAFTPRALFAQLEKQPVRIGWPHANSRALGGQ